MNNHRIKTASPVKMNPIPTGLQPQGALSQPVKALLFDIYGTLFISGSGDISIAEKQSQNASSLNELLQAFSISRTAASVQQDFFSEIENVHARLRSTGVDFPEVNIVEIWQTVLNLPDPKSAERFSIQYEMMVNPAYPMPHLKEILSWCSRRQLLLGIISNAQFFTPQLFTQFLDAAPAALGFDPDLIFYSYQFGYAKPSSYLFKKAADSLLRKSISAGSVLYVGNDMLNDMLPAQKTGFQTALFAGDRRSLRLREEHPDCRNLKPHLIITDLIQLTEHLV